MISKWSEFIVCFCEFIVQYFELHMYHEITYKYKIFTSMNATLNLIREFPYEFIV
jgi:hypothetical protein